MNYLINQLMTVDKAFYRHYLEMLLTLNRIQALTPWVQKRPGHRDRHS